MAESTKRSASARRRAEEGGFVLAMTALLLIPLLIFAAFATDVGAWYVKSQQIQRAADAASLAAVVWMPNEDRAARAALEVAKRNGFEDLDSAGNPTNTTTATAAQLAADFDTGPEPQVKVTRTNGQEIRVDIRAEGSVFFGALVIDEVEIERFAIAEYVLPVPMGNPSSALGTGTDTGYGNVDNFWLRANDTCELRANGDFIGAAAGVTRCDNVASGFNYEPGGLLYVIDVPPDVSGNAAQAWELQARLTCFITNRGSTVSGGGATQDYEWRQRESDGPMNFKIYAPDDTPLNDRDNLLAPTSAVADLQRPDNSVCGTAVDGENTAGGGGSLNQWRTAGPGNPAGPTGDPAPWVTIANVNSPGRWVMEAKNNATELKLAGTPVGYDGSTDPDDHSWAQYSLRVVPPGYNNSTNTWACTRAGTDASATCPNIYAAEFLAVTTIGTMFSNGEIPTTTDGLNANLYLAEIDDVHKGKTIEITMFDPADGIDLVRVLDPFDNPVDLTWETVDVGQFGYQSNYSPWWKDFSYTSDYPLVTQECGGQGCITENKNNEASPSSATFDFQDRTVRIFVKLPDDYACREVAGEPKDCWWKVRYEDTNSNATETTTWGVRLIGDPVRLVE